MRLGTRFWPVCPLAAFLPAAAALCDTIRVAEQISITVNGDTRNTNLGASVADLLRELGLESGRVAIERNREILPRTQWLETRLAQGDAFEIVHFVGGG